MNRKKCPYCGKRISYSSVFYCRKKSEYVCERCGKESRVIINKKVTLVFILCALLSIAIMAGWIFAGLSYNPLGILFVALPLLVFTLISTKFLKFEPLKKYKKSMEARKAGIEYSDNLMVNELDEKDNVTPDYSVDSNSQFQINSDVFNKIKADRTSAREKLKEGQLISNSEKIESKDDYVPVIKNVSEKHSYADAPLKKIHSESPVTQRRRHHYVEVEEADDVKEYKKSDGNKYSANRRF